MATIDTNEEVISGGTLEFAAKWLGCIPRDISLALRKRVSAKPAQLREAVEAALDNTSEDGYTIDEIMSFIAQPEYMACDRVLYWNEKLDVKPSWTIKLNNFLITEEWGNQFGIHARGASPQEAILNLWRRLSKSKLVLVQKQSSDKDYFYAAICWDEKRWIDLALTQEEMRKIVEKLRKRNIYLPEETQFVSYRHKTH
ncbi:MAG: hypothetical protein DWQ49_12640 [Bacteroidetes bacterium]|nr:MAG: hypothetical protein DWQ49_12640 [Bacteroidota bacterium]